MPPYSSSLVSQQLLGANDYDDGDSYVVDLSRQILEIYSVQILNTHSENPANLYGTIVADARFTPRYFYNRDSSNPEKIRPYECLKLGSPEKFMTTYDSFEIEFNLMDDDSPSPDKAVIKETWFWDYCNYHFEYNKVTSEVVTGRYGSAVLEYAVFSHAVGANVEVTLIKDGGENWLNVYGKILATNDLVTTPVLLFHENKDNYVDVRPEQKIPLSRSLVIVDDCSSMNIEAALSDYDSDDVIVQGRVAFEAQYAGVTTKRIKGKYGEIVLKVTWLR